MERVYLFDPDAKTVVEKGKQNSRGTVVVDGELTGVSDFIAIPVKSFYQHEAVQNVVPKGQVGTQAHVKCMCCGFETVYGAFALIKDVSWENKRNGYPKRSNSCRECGENAWKEIRWQSGTCDWSDSFEWADPPEV